MHYIPNLDLFFLPQSIISKESTYFRKTTNLLKNVLKKAIMNNALTRRKADYGTRERSSQFK